MSKVSYRQAQLSDLDALAHLRWEFRTAEDEVDPKLSFESFCEKCRNFLIQGLESGRWTYWIAEIDDHIISHAFVQRVVKVPTPNRIQDEWGYVTNCYTKAEFRSQGVGTTLMKEIIEWARKIDLEILIVWPSDGSREYYKRLGFSEENDVLQLTLRAE